MFLLFSTLYIENLLENLRITVANRNIFEVCHRYNATIFQQSCVEISIMSVKPWKNRT